MKPAGRKHAILIILLALFVGGCGEEKSPPPAPETSAQTVPSAPQASTDKAPAPPTPAVSQFRNLPPKVDSVKLTPDVVLPGTTITAVAEASDPDGDLVMLDFEWTRNGQALAGAVTDELDTTGFAKGDLVRVAVTPFDGSQKGESKRSLPVIILNRPPVITSFPPPAAAEGKYVYEVVAEDPDGDPLEFSLEEAPADMTIDAATGRLQWDVPGDQEGEFQVRIVVSDRDAQAFQGFSGRLKKE